MTLQVNGRAGQRGRGENALLTVSSRRPPLGVWKREMMNTALLVIDLQQEFARRTELAAAEGPGRSNPGAEAVVAGALALYRAQGWTVVHVHHDDPNPASRFRRDRPGFAPMDCARPLAGEAVFVKRTSGAFGATGLAQWLEARGIKRLAVVGASVNHCVSSTLRAGYDAGFTMAVLRDGVFGFDLPRIDTEGMIAADVVLEVVLASLGRELVQVISAATLEAWTTQGAATE